MEELKKNHVFRAVIDGYTSGGLGVARLNGRAVFVEGAARGDDCLLRLVKIPASGPLYARIETLETASPVRQPDGCSIAGRCGGCDFQHIQYGEELKLKEERVRDALTRIAKIDLVPERIMSAPGVSGYRNKALFPVRMAEGRPSTGFFRARSHMMMPAETCAIQNGMANACAAALRGWMARYKIPAYDEQTGGGLVRHLFVRTGASTGQVLCALAVTRPKLPQGPALIQALREACPGLVGVVLDLNTRRDNVILTGRQRTLWGQDWMEDILCGLRFRLSVMSFYQVNPAQAERLYEKAQEMAGLTSRETVLELYCGAGTLSLCLARAAAKVIGVDIVQKAVADARGNAERNGIENAEFRLADAGQAAEVLAEEGVRPDVLVVDPPRKGLDETVVGALKTLVPARMVYISCDPATLARDLARLRDVGYQADRCAPVDMFPRTAHVETVVLLSKLKSATSI